MPPGPSGLLLPQVPGDRCRVLRSCEPVKVARRNLAAEYHANEFKAPCRQNACKAFPATYPTSRVGRLGSATRWGGGRRGRRVRGTNDSSSSHRGVSVPMGFPVSSSTGFPFVVGRHCVRTPLLPFLWSPPLRPKRTPLRGIQGGKPQVKRYLGKPGIPGGCPGTIVPKDSCGQPLRWGLLSPCRSIETDARVRR